MEQEKKNWGGKREGAGRKKTSVKTYFFSATQEVYDILEAVEGSKSSYICKCIILASRIMKETEEKPEQ